MTRSYLVCATPRSGSTLLCEALRETGVAGNPLEFFEAVPATRVPRHPIEYLAGLEDPHARGLIERVPPNAAPWYSDLRGTGTYADHLHNVRRWGTTANDVFGAKIMWAHLEDLGRQCGATDLHALIDTLFDRPSCVWVRRTDKVRQAVSMWRAMQTQSWRAENERAAGEPRYSFPALRHLVELLSTYDAAWERFFGARGDVLILTYEDVAADLAGALRSTLDYVGVAVPGPALQALPTMRRQADERSDAWAAAYARDAVAAAR
jgi:trehalose 2-sulfotransferase